MTEMKKINSQRFLFTIAVLFISILCLVFKTTRALAEEAQEEKETAYPGSMALDFELSIFDASPSQSLESGEVDFVTITIGGNDMGFAELMSTAALVPSFLFPNVIANFINDKWEEYDEHIRTDIIQAYRDIADTVGPQAKIIVAGYPKLLDPEGSGFLFSGVEADKMNQAASDFNDRIEELVKKENEGGLNIYFVDVEGKFENHGAYAENSFVNELILPTTEQDLDRKGAYSAASFHPNEKGAEVYYECVRDKILELLPAYQIRIEDEFGKAIPSSLITLRIEKDSVEKHLKQTYDSENELYTVNLWPGKFMLYAEAEGYVPAEVEAVIHKQQKEEGKSVIEMEKLATFRARIKERDSEKDLEGVRVLLVSEKQTAEGVSDSQGIIEIKDLIPGEYTVLFSLDGYENENERWDMHGIILGGDAGIVRMEKTPKWLLIEKTEGGRAARVTTTYTYDEQGRLEEESSWNNIMGSSRYLYQYDADGLLILKKHLVNRFSTQESVDDWTDYQYDSEGKCIKYTYHTSSSSMTDHMYAGGTCEYDEKGRLTRDYYVIFRSSIYTTKEYTFDEQGNLLIMDVLSNGQSSDRSYESCERYTYMYNEEGIRIGGKMVRSQGSVGSYDRNGKETGTEKVFSYDDRGYLIRELDMHAGVITGWISYEYDQYGNLVLEQYYNADGELTDTISYRYAALES